MAPHQRLTLSRMRKLIRMKELMRADVFLPLKHRAFLWPLALLVAVAPFVSFVSVRALGAIVPVLALLSFFLSDWRANSRILFSRPTIVALVIFCSVILLAAIRSYDPSFAFERVGKLFSLTAVALVLLSFKFEKDEVGALAAVLTVFTLVALIWALVEGLSDGAIYAMTKSDLAYWEAAHAANRPMVILTLIIWPVMQIASRQWGEVAGVALLLCTLLAAAFTESQSAQLGMLTGFVIYLFSRRFPVFGLN
ncbi:MAG: hypothetical protein RLN89_05295, partial [Parvibaculum sp.]